MMEFHAYPRRRQPIPITVQGWKRAIWSPVWVLIWACYGCAVALTFLGLCLGFIGETVSGWLYEVRA